MQDRPTAADRTAIERQIACSCAPDRGISSGAMAGDVYILDAVRTPIGRHGGALAGVRPDDLAAHVVGQIVAAARTSTPRGSTTSSSATPTGPARTTATSPAWRCCSPACRRRSPGATVNRLCGSGLEAAVEASRAIAVGDASLHRGRRRVDEPRALGHAQARARLPARARDAVVDHARLAHGQPADAGEWTVALGEGAEILADRYEISREDRTSSRSAATSKRPRPGTRGVYADEVVPVPDTELERDESIRADTSLEKLAKLSPPSARTAPSPPATPRRSTTAPRALLLGRRGGRRGRRARAAGADRLAGGQRRRPAALRHRPGRGRRPGARRAGHRLGRPRAGRAQRGVRGAVAGLPGEWTELDPEIVNPNGGAIAIGHPLGCSGGACSARWPTSCAAAAAAAGLAAICIGVGQGWPWSWRRDHRGPLRPAVRPRRAARRGLGRGLPRGHARVRGGARRRRGARGRDPAVRRRGNRRRL